MNRTGLIIALVIAAAIGLIFAIWPDLDLALAAPFYDPATGGVRGGFWRAYDPTWWRMRDAATWLITLTAMPPFVALIIKLIRPSRPLTIPLRAILLMLITLALGPGVLTNLILKEHWGRPRPIDVTQFGGDEHFVPWWDPRGDCPKNCSFVSGEASGAFWTLAPAAVVPPQWRVLATAGALAFGAATGGIRMAAGAHFVTDVVFAGVLMFLLIWLVHAWLYRWVKSPLP
jgi:membrane-associated PAP2 superfamily phosphatase